MITIYGSNNATSNNVKDYKKKKREEKSSRFLK